MGCWTIRVHVHIYIYRCASVYFISLGGMEAMKEWRATRNYYPFTALKLLPRSFRGIKDIVKPTYHDLSCQFPETGISRGGEKIDDESDPALRFSVPETQTEV